MKKESLSINHMKQIDGNDSVLLQSTFVIRYSAVLTIS